MTDEQDVDAPFIDYCVQLTSAVSKSGKVKSLGDAMFLTSMIFNGLAIYPLPDHDSRVNVARKQHKIHLKLIKNADKFR